MSYISQSDINSSWNHEFPARNRTNVWILSIGTKEPKTVQQCLEAISSQKLIGKCNRVNAINACRYKDIIRNNLQENIFILNQIKHINEIGNKLISLPKKHPTPDYIGDLLNSPLVSEWYNSIFSNYGKMEASTTFSAPF